MDDWLNTPSSISIALVKGSPLNVMPETAIPILRLPTPTANRRLAPAADGQRKCYRVTIRRVCVSGGVKSNRQLVPQASHLSIHYLPINLNLYDAGARTVANSIEGHGFQFHDVTLVRVGVPVIGQRFGVLRCRFKLAADEQLNGLDS